MDGISFIFKYNPLNGAIAPKARVWRKRSEGLIVTGRGSKELAGGKRLHVMVAIASGKGVVLKVPYKKMDGPFFKKFLKQHFNICFARCGPKKDSCRLFLMNNNPSQTSKVVQKAMENIDAEFHKIPARSPDLNPIENIFHLVKKSLDHETANNITCETFNEFSERVLNSMENLLTEIIDRTIASLSSRVDAVRRARGNRIKY